MRVRGFLRLIQPAQVSSRVSETMDVDVQDTSSDEDVVVGESNPRRQALSREERNCLETFCAHPQIRDYTRSRRGRRGGIYIPASQAASFDTHLYINPITVRGGS